MKIIRTKQALKDAIRRLRAEGKTIGLVPTMGALHDGHISLTGVARQHVTAIVTSIFVNPTQFGPQEDFSRYPRTENQDIDMLEKTGVDIAYLPSAEEMYPAGCVTQIHAGSISEALCGAFRPGHFNGVATVVAKFLLQAQPDIAVFGEKDYQQLHIIRQMVADLDIPAQIIGAPIMREEDGLAMSSRNRYLSISERKIAALLYRVLQETANTLRAGQKKQGEILELAKRQLLQSGFSKVDYMELRNAETLRPTEHAIPPVRLLAAAYLGITRLIDNIPITI